jgi:tetratricopeptide (TPR) repeat protein
MVSTSPDPEKILGDAIDLIADGREEEAAGMLDAFALALKAGMNGSDADAMRYYWWGRALSLLDEWEQALLRFESALQISPDYEAALWETAMILQEELDKPDSARAILKERLLKLSPGHPEYTEALASAEALIRRRDGRPLKPWKEGEVEAGEEGLEESGGLETPEDLDKA